GARIGDSFNDTIVQYVSAPVASFVMPPVVRVDTRIFTVSAVLRSGEIGKTASPRFVVVSTGFPPTYSVDGLCGEMRYGVFQLKRRSSAAESVFCRVRMSAIDFFCAAVCGAVVSPRSMSTESSYMS